MSAASSYFHLQINTSLGLVTEAEQVTSLAALEQPKTQHNIHGCDSKGDTDSSESSRLYTPAVPTQACIVHVHVNVG